MRSPPADDDRPGANPTGAELLLVRHAESAGNIDGSHGDTELSSKGVAQATELAARLASEHFDLVLASPLRRARRTAELALPNVQATIEPALRELVVQPDQFIDVAGMSPEQIRTLLASARDKTAETGAQFIKRVSAWRDSLPDRGRIIAFTHFAVIRECLRQAGVQPLPQHLGYCEVFRLAATR